MKLFKHLSVKWKIYLIAIVSIIGFGSYLAFNVWVNGNNAKLLTSLSNVNFPVLEKANANRVRLDRLSELLNSAVLTGEQDYIENAEATALQMDRVFNEILVLVPEQQEQLLEVTTNFNEFYSLAKQIATEMSQGAGDMTVLRPSIEKKEIALTKLKTELDSFIQQARNTFSGNIDTANSNSLRLLTSGFIIWIINILILTVTVYAIARIILTNINNVSTSLHEIAHGGGDFSKKIVVGSTDEIGNLATSFNELMDNLREKTNDLISMMENMHQGLFTITDKEVIHQEYSAYIEEIFKTKSVAGRHFADLLFGGAMLGSDTLNQIKVAVSSLLGSDEMMFEFNKHLLVKEYTIEIKEGDETISKILELDWDPILSDGEIHKIMVTVRDVTELKIMQAAAEEQKKELQIIGQILKASPEKFDKFVENAFKLIEKNQVIIQNNATKNLKAVADLFVNMHTVKGNARTYNFSFITNPVHEAEDIYDRLRKEAEYPWDREALIADLLRVKEALTQYQQVKMNKLTFAEPAGALNRDMVCIDKNAYKKLLQEFDGVLQSDQVDIARFETLYHKAKAFDAIKFELVMGELIDSLPSLARQLEKEPPQLHLDISSLAIRMDYADMLNDVFTHLLRNSVDHGVEGVSERIAKQKSASGNIYVQAQFSAKGATLVLSDDGRGLNLKRIKQKAIEANQLTEADTNNPQKIAECLFLSGVSTAETITAISGRGVGMDAVKQYLHQNGCGIELVLAEGASAQDDFVPFQIKILLPQNVYEVVA